jgi:hypothetical protein
MSRGDWDREPREETRDGRPERRPRRGRARQAPPRTITLPRGHDREAVRLGTRTLWLSGKDTQVLTIVGRFGSAFSNDLRDTLYDGRQRHARRSLDKLQEQGLIDRREWTHARYQWGAIVTLTREGKRLLDRAVLDDQRPRELDGHVSSGWHKLRELTHDATLYYLYTQERARIESAGGRVVSVQTERDLKASLFASTEVKLAAVRRTATRHARRLRPSTSSRSSTAASNCPTCGWRSSTRTGRARPGTSSWPLSTITAGISARSSGPAFESTASPAAAHTHAPRRRTALA